jgi:DNA-directed RNA polymerase subunit beta'
MMAPLNIFSPSSGKPIMTPTQDITLGCYYLTAEPRKPRREKERLMLFGTKNEAIFAHNDGALKTHDRILLLNPDQGRETKYGDAHSKLIETTVGRVLFSEIWPTDLGFINKPIGKSQLGDVIFNCYKYCGHERTVVTLDRLKEIGFREATRAGVSIGIDDMIVPIEKEKEIENALKQISEVDKQHRKGVITNQERYNKVIDIWTHCTDQIGAVMLKTLQNNQGKKEFNPVHLMVDSGARGNKAQVRQLAGLRGLMAKPSGEIIEKPILSSFREGLTVLEYFISTHGARKGLADTALKTADSGYMTRKLVDAAQDVIVRQIDCGTTNGISVGSIYEGEEEVVKISERIFGRYSAEDIYDPTDLKHKIIGAGEEFDEFKSKAVERATLERVKIRSALTCETKHGVCAKCYGRNLATGRLVKLGEAVGIIAAQSIGEPGTQLTMRTFHVGGVASQTYKQPQIKTKVDGTVRYNELRYVTLEDGNNIVLNKNGTLSIYSPEGKELETHSIVIGSVISVPDGGQVKKNEVFVEWDAYNVPVISEKGGRVKFVDIIEGVTMKQEVDEATGTEDMVIIEHKEDLHPTIILEDQRGEPLAQYPIPAGAHLVVAEEDEINAGALLAKTPRKASKTKDITGGLPRVAELFEARRPKDAAEIAKIDGIVDFGPSVRGKRCVLVKDPQTNQEEEHLIPMGKHVIVYKGDFVKKGQQLTDGPVVPHEILDVCGPQELQEHLVNEIQEVYRLQGVTINDKHIEIIIRQMLKKVRITEPGDTIFLWGEQIDKVSFEDENQRIEKIGGKPAEGVPVLLGITKASLETESFLSAASFQDTTRVLTEAATLGKSDGLRGFKENVIMGHIIPAGTGYPGHRDMDVRTLVEVPIEEAPGFDLTEGDDSGAPSPLLG